MTIVPSAARRGFTLIELLVVIAIIGILSSVVLASLNTARNRGADAAIRSNLNNARAQSELYFDGNTQSYTGVCAVGTNSVAQFVTGAQNAGSATVNCGVNTTTNAWAMSAQLRSSTQWYCVDSTGQATTTGAATTANGQAAGTDVTC